MKALPLMWMRSALTAGPASLEMVAELSFRSRSSWASIKLSVPRSLCPFAVQPLMSVSPWMWA